MSSVDPAGLPYRPCAGIALFNREGLVWIGRRIDGPQEAEGIGHWWQMPQGGIDGDEDPVAAAKRELAEETADLMILLMGTAIAANFDLKQAFWDKMDKIMQRDSKMINGRIRVSEFK